MTDMRDQEATRVALNRQVENARKELDLKRIARKQQWDLEVRLISSASTII